MKRYTTVKTSLILKINLVIVFAFYAVTGFGQCPHKVIAFPSHGEQTIDGVKLRVYAKGGRGAYNSDCAGPYLIPSTSGTYGGQYIFTFTPAVAVVSLNISSVSNYSLRVSEISIYKNDVHYPILNAGTSTSCEPLAALSPSGNIVGCENCSASGYNGIIINGPISKLAVHDTIFVGDGGSTFSLFFCKYNFTDLNTLTENSVSVSPNPFKESAVLKLPPFQRAASLKIFNTIGQCVRSFDHIQGESLKVERDNLPAGIYHYVLLTDGYFSHQGKLLLESL